LIYVGGYASVVPLTSWLPAVTYHADGFRITPVWGLDGDNPVLVALTIMSDPESDLHLDAATFDRLPVWKIVAAGPVPDRLARAVEVYKAADDAGQPRARAVAAELGIGEASASNLIVQLRKQRLLPPTRPGVAAA
jgi:hypothetical protein